MPQGFRTLSIENFQGGWNCRDAWSQVGDNECPDMMNMTLDERGALVKRLGLLKYNATQLGSDQFENLFFWPTLGYLIAQQGTTLYYSSALGGTWTTTTKSFSTSARVGMCEFQGKLVVVHPVDGVWTSVDGTTWSQTTGGSANMEAVRGNCIAVWQNKCWVGGDPNNKPRVWWSDAGDPAKWTIATSWVDIREKDDAIVTAIGGGEGMDVSGRPGLFVFKAESYVRINSSTTGSYTMMDNRYGAGGPLAVTSNLGVTAAISHRGIVVCANDGTASVLASDKISPFFHPSQIAYGQASNMVAGFYHDRMVFSLARFGSSTNNISLEFHPAIGWIVPHSFGAAAFATYTGSDERLYAAGATSGYAFQVFKGGADNGAAIAARAQTRWFELSGSHACRFRKLLVNGRGTYSLYVKRDYTLGVGDLYNVSITGSGMVWGTGVWGVDIWGPDTYQDYQPFYSLGVGRAISFELAESSTTSATAPKLLDDGAADEVGSFALYGLNADYVPLGVS